MVSLPLEAYQAVQSPEPAMIARGFGAAATLLILVLVLFALARIVGGRGAGRLSAGQLRRRTAASGRDKARYLARYRAATNQQDEYPHGHHNLGEASS
jgi:phosphate transport system permease protein